MTLVFEATANEEAIDLEETSLGSALVELAQSDGKVRLVGIDGAGTALFDEVVDLTPRLPNGALLKVDQRRDEAILATLGALEERINAGVQGAEGKAVLLGLTQLQLAGDVWVVSSLLDTTDPLAFDRMAWDVDPAKLVTVLGPELPELRGNVTFVVRGTSGEQPTLRPIQVAYREEVWRAVMEAAGATRVEFDYADVGGPPVSAVAAPIVPVPPPPSTPVPVVEHSCVLDTSAYFVADETILLDEEAFKGGLGPCVAAIPPLSKINIAGHTAGPHDDNAQRISDGRAATVERVLRELGVTNPVESRGFGSTRQPDPTDIWSPANRAVVIATEIP